jgi:hypothetical protein
LLHENKTQKCLGGACMPRIFVLHEYATTFHLRTYHCDLYDFQAGHGDNVRGGTAQRRGVVECMQQVLCDQVLHTDDKLKQRGLVFVKLHASTTPQMQFRYFRCVRTTFFVHSNSMTGFP